MGIVTGIIIIIFSIIVFSLSPSPSSDTQEIKPIETNNITPQSEAKNRYGGDAYTGIQQASAQAATNLVAVYDNIDQTNSNLEALNSNIINHTDQTEALASFLQTALGFLILSIGLLTVVKHLGLLLTETGPSVQPNEPVFQEDNIEIETVSHSKQTSMIDDKKPDSFDSTSSENDLNLNQNL